MPMLSKLRASQRPAKFNFLDARVDRARRDWPLGHTPAAAKAVAESKRGSK